jgi:hypothetical protein
MIRHANLVKQAMELRNNGRNLRRQVTGIHGVCHALRQMLKLGPSIWGGCEMFLRFYANDYTVSEVDASWWGVCYESKCANVGTKINRQCPV